LQKLVWSVTLTSSVLIAWLPCLKAQNVDVLTSSDRPALVKEATEAKSRGDLNLVYKNLGINLLSARQINQGIMVRVKRLIKPGADTAKDIARGIPLISPIANVATLGLFNRALKPDGKAVRSTWMSLNCQNKTFNVSNDGYSWQSIYNDPHGQAEDIFYYFCVTADGHDKPLYLSLPHADAHEMRSAQLKSPSSRGEAVLPVEPVVPTSRPEKSGQEPTVSPLERQGML
jgi:hypothetical protein